jgi:hypothetical protein
LGFKPRINIDEGLKKITSKLWEKIHQSQLLDVKYLTQIS